MSGILSHKAPGIGDGGIEKGESVPVLQEPSRFMRCQLGIICPSQNMGCSGFEPRHLSCLVALALYRRSEVIGRE